MEIARITGALALDLAEAGPNDPFVKLVLGGRSPREVATDMVNGTKLNDPEFRKKLVDGGEAAVAASTDPMIVLARKLDPMRRELIKWTEDNVESVLQRAGEQLGKARFAAFGKTTYPDATFTLRLSYGKVQGYPMNGTIAPPKTTLYGLYDRAASFDLQAPFDLPQRYLDGREKLDLTTPLEFRHDERHYRRQLGFAGDQSQRRDRRSDLRRQHRILVGDFVYEGDNQSRRGGSHRRR